MATTQVGRKRSEGTSVQTAGNGKRVNAVQAKVACAPRGAWRQKGGAVEYATKITPPPELNNHEPITTNSVRPGMSVRYARAAPAT